MSEWGAERFAREARALGVDPIVEGNLVRWSYAAPLGPRADEPFELGFEVPADWPETPPHGPHVRPPVDHPGGNNHPSVFGADWRHWSRPFNGWGQAERTFENYMSHIRNLFNQL